MIMAFFGGIDCRAIRIYRRMKYQFARIVELTTLILGCNCCEMETCG